jgi:hypothetical protein
MAFKPGQSGNPKGRAPGSKDKRQRWREALAERLPDLIEQLEAKARAGDQFAIKMILERVAPPLRPQGPTVLIPELASAGTLVDKAEAILKATGEGLLPVDTARALLDSVAALAKIREVDDILRRVEALEKDGAGRA